MTAIALPRWALAVVGILFVVLVGLAVERGLAWQDTRATASASQDAVDAAVREVTALISIDKSTSDADVAVLVAGATGDFRDELTDQAEELRMEAKRNKVRSTGEVNSAGLERINDGADRAVVVVAASGVVRNRNTKGQEPRRYRFRVDVSKTGDEWLVAGLEFVQ